MAFNKSSPTAIRTELQHELDPGLRRAAASFDKRTFSDEAPAAKPAEQVTSPAKTAGEAARQVDSTRAREVVASEGIPPEWPRTELEGGDELVHPPGGGDLLVGGDGALKEVHTANGDNAVMGKAGAESVVAHATIDGAHYENIGNGQWRVTSGKNTQVVRGWLSVNEKTGAFDWFAGGEHTTFHVDGSKFHMHGNGSTREFSPSDQLVKTSDINRQETLYSYDHNGALNRIEIKAPPEPVPNEVPVLYERDANGAWSMTKAEGTKVPTQHQFTLSNDGTLVVRNGDQTLTTRLDGAKEFSTPIPGQDGNRLVHRNDGAKMVLARDNRVISMTDATGRHTEFTYDRNSQIKSITFSDEKNKALGLSNPVYESNGDGTWSFVTPQGERIPSAKTFSFAPAEGALTIREGNEQIIERLNCDRRTSDNPERHTAGSPGRATSGKRGRRPRCDKSAQECTCG